MDDKNKEKRRTKKIPQSIEEYEVKFVFKENSEKNVNNIFKESFLIKLNSAKI